MKWEIVSFKGVGPIRYGMTEEDLLRACGEPKKKWKAPDLEYRYHGYTVRFNEKHKVNEVSFYAHVPENELFHEHRRLDWEGSFVLDLCVLDGDPRERHGYIYLLNIGMALVDFFDDYDIPVITVFQGPLEEEKQFPLVDMGELKRRMQDVGILGE